MSALVLDAGAFLGVERGNREVTQLLEVAQRNGIDLRTSAIILGQIWRGGTGKQATVARLLAKVDVLPVDVAVGQATGILIGKAGTKDPIDAAVVLAARPGDTILTSDPGDIAHLGAAVGSAVVVLAC